MTAHVRPERVGHEIQAAVADILSRGQLRDPRIGFITITGVKMSPDLRVARVYYSMLGSAEERQQTEEGLANAKGFIRREVTARLKLKFSPEIFFTFDESIGEGDKIDRLLREVKEKEGW
jgi:ribosome-binding factor A